jgi:regulator of RNase E activity RraB
MMSEMDDEFEDAPGFHAQLDEQLAMVKDSWALLQKRGYVPGQKVAIHFVYVAQKRDKAERLKAYFQAQNGYEMKLVNNDDEYEISGKTPPVEVSLEILEAWIRKMLTLGADYECAFDGWTTAFSTKSEK